MEFADGQITAQITEKDVLHSIETSQKLEMETLKESAAYIKESLLAIKEMQEALNAIAKDKVIMKGFLSALTARRNENAENGKCRTTEKVNLSQVRHFMTQKKFSGDNYDIIASCVELIAEHKKALETKSIIFNTQTKNKNNRKTNDNNTSASNA